MNAAEIRADMVGELRAAASGYESLGVRNLHLAGTCRDLAAQLRANADSIERSSILHSPSSNFSQSHTATRLADGSTAARVDFKLNAAAPSSAANFSTDKAEGRKQKVEMEQRRAA